MMRWSLLVCALMLVPGAMAAINEERPFEAEFEFNDPLEDEFINIVSGQLDAGLAKTTGPFGFFGVKGFTIQDLNMVCWGKPSELPQAMATKSQCIEGNLRIDVEDDSNIALQFATRTTGSYSADHALALFLRQRGDDLNTLSLNQSMLVPAINGKMDFGDIPAFSYQTWRTVPLVFNLLVPTSESTTISIAGGASHTLSGRDEFVTFFGDPRIEVFGSDFVALPFTDGSNAEFSPADPEAAKEGLDFTRVEQVLNLLQGASAEQSNEQSEDIGDNPFADSMSEVLNSALIRVPSKPDVDADVAKDEVAIVLFQDLAVANGGGDLAWDGDAAFQYQGGEIAGSQSLYGVWLVKLPWWGWLLWAVAIGLFVTRMVLKPEKKHERWDRYKWIGWVSGILMFALVFFLWDLEMRSVWGTSIMSTSATGTAFWVTFGIQLATFFMVLGVLGWPLGIIIKNALLLSRQGTFMNLGKPVAVLLAFLLGATLFLAYLELFVQEALAQV